MSNVLPKSEKATTSGMSRRGFLGGVGASGSVLAGASLMSQNVLSAKADKKPDGPPTGMPKIGFFSEAERDFRWNRVRKMMKEQGLDCLVVPSPSGGDFPKYASYLADGGFFMHSGAVILPAKGVPALFGQLPRPDGWIRDVAPKFQSLGDQMLAKLQSMGMQKANIGVVGTQSGVTGLNEFTHDGLISYASWSTVLAGLPEARFKDVTPEMAELLAIRSAEEHGYMKEAADLSEGLHQRMMEMATPGTSDRQFRIGVAECLIGNGARADVQALEMKPGIITEGDVINSEYGVWVGGGYCQATLCIAVGKVSQEIEDLAKVAHEAFDVGAEHLKPGASFGEVVARMQRVISKANFWTGFPVLHDMGNLFMVAPVANFPPPFKPSKTLAGHVEIKPDMVFSFEPNARSGMRDQVKVGGTAIITNDGPKFLNTIGQRMQRV